MMSRALFVASCLAVASAELSRDAFRAHCAVNAQCGGEVCCAAGWQMKDNNMCVNKGDGAECGLCGQAKMTPCDFTASALYPVLLDASGTEVTSSAAKVVGGGVIGAAAVPAPLAPTTPSSGVRLTLGTFNGMKGWIDITEAAFYGFQEFLLGLTATVPSFYTAAAYSVVYTCDKNGLANVPAGFVGCDIFFFVYRCPPCDSKNGNIGQQLLAMTEPTWHADNCGPTFKLNKAMGIEHQFAVYMAEIADGTTTEVQLAADVEFMFWAMVPKSVICNGKTEAECGASPINCEWLDVGVCKPRGCPPPGPFSGPNTPRCSVCVDDEAAFVPEVMFT